MGANFKPTLFYNDLATAIRLFITENLEAGSDIERIEQSIRVATLAAIVDYERDKQS